MNLHRPGPSDSVGVRPATGGPVPAEPVAPRMDGAVDTGQEDEDRSILPGAHPVLSCAEALAWESALLGGDETREWAAMARAGRAVAHAVMRDACEVGGLGEHARLLVLCGKGHNGGDALIALRHLLEACAGASALVLVVPGFARLRPLVRRAMEDVQRAHGRRVDWIEVDGALDARDAARVWQALAGREFDLCLDGLFGMQFRSPLRAPADWLIELVNAHRRIRLRASVDLPSGLGDAGDTQPFSADFTYATGIVKRPALLAPCAGRLRYLDLDFFEHGWPRGADELILTEESLGALRRGREANTDKRTFGHLFVVSGSRTMPGAVMMSVEAALRSGVGLVTAFVPESLAAVGAARLPEAMWEPMPETPAGGLALEGRGAVVARAARCTGLLVGPGLGRERESLALAAELLRAIDVPAVLDADALQPDLVAVRGPEASAPRVVTPHAGELARIAGTDTPDPREVARTFGCTVAAKGAPTRITSGGAVYVSPFGGPVLARGGSGDVLAGLIAGQLAQGVDALEAAARGVVWHGLAADRLARATSQHAARATDLCVHLGPVLQDLAHG